MASIDEKVATVAKGFNSGKTRPYKYRLAQLRALEKALKTHYDSLVAALGSDLGRSRVMSKMSEAEHMLDLVKYTASNLKLWMRDDARDMPAMFLPANAYVHYEPLGVMLIMGSWNFPFDVTLGPLVSAIAAGNAAIVKPSEMSVTSAAVTARVIEALDPECYQVVQGGPDVAADLVSRKWDCVFFTGSTEKGRLVSQSVAKTMTPCLLELGGKNPTIVDRDASLTNAALRITQGRTLNVGQACISPEYVFVHESVAAEFERLLVATLKQFFGEEPKNSPDLGRIVNTMHTQRIARLLETHGGEVVCGGTVSVEERYVAPTIIRSPKLDSPLMQEEVFGPVLSLFTFREIGECIEFINARDRPLVVYYFGSANKDEVMDRTISGGFVQNETCFQYSVPDLPFGGVGASGIGRYHGEEGFRCMSNTKSVLEKDTYNGPPVSLRYPPHTEERESRFMAIKSLANFSTADMRKAIFRSAVLSSVVFAVYKGYLGKHTWTSFKDYSLRALEAIGVKKFFDK